MDIEVKVIGQKLRIPSNLKIFSPNSQEFVKFIFDMTPDWDGLTVFAQFRQGEETYNIYLDEDNSVMLPNELTHGRCYLTLYGTEGNTVGTSNCIELFIDDSRFIASTSNIDVTPTLYAQLVDTVNNYKSDTDAEIDSFKAEVNAGITEFESDINFQMTSFKKDRKSVV